jgi:hypothetical protein
LTSFDLELRECLGELLGVLPPEPDGEALVFYKQWLGGRNLGLVPVDDPNAFSWAGKWLARVGEHAVVMFGAPSGPLVDPAGALRDGAAIDAGWVLAPLDVQLPTAEAPYGADAGTGTVAALLVAPEKETPLVRVDQVTALARMGLDGDRYARGAGTFSAPGRGYELTLVEGEVLDEVALPWEQARRNVVTRGVALNALVGREFRIGEVVCVGRRLAEPCAHLERLARPGLLRPLVHRGGLRADIVTGGVIHVGDEICSS